MILRFRTDCSGGFGFVLLFVLAIFLASSSLLSCRVTVEGDPYYQGPGPRPAHSSRIEGQWLFNAFNHTGRLELYWTRNVWVGRILFDNLGQWEELTDIFMDPRTGQVQFHRVKGNQQYSGTLSGNQIEGTFFTPGLGTFPWKAWRQ